MQNPDLVRDYLTRSAARLKAIDILVAEASWADVVRQSQEVVELCLKALLRSVRIELPRVHDVSPVLTAERHRLPPAIQNDLDFLVRTSRSLRRDRELSFYGSEDLVPSEFYGEPDAVEALESARKVHATVSRACGIDRA
jgi:HEPN domain-containing protein